MITLNIDEKFSLTNEDFWLLVNRGDILRFTFKLSVKTFFNSHYKEKVFTIDVKNGDALTDTYQGDIVETLLNHAKEKGFTIHPSRVIINVESIAFANQ